MDNILPSPRKRLVILDFYRFLAAMGVVFFHATEVEINAKSIIKVGDFGLFVDFFFILSGFVMALTYGEIRLLRSEYLSFIAKRIARVYPLHALMMLIYVVFFALRDGAFFQEYDSKDFITNVLMMHAWGLTDNLTLNGPSWSISAEFLCYLLFPFIMVLARKLNVLVFAAICIAIFYLLSRQWLPIWQQDGMYGANYDFGFLRALPSFLIGVATFGFAKKSRNGSRIHLFLGLVFFFGSFVLMYGAKPIYVMMSFTFSIYFISTYETNNIVNKKLSIVLEKFGNNSYSLYMIHIFVFSFIAKYIWEYFGLELKYFPYFFVLIIFITLILSNYIFVLFENPVRRIISRLLLSRIRQAPLANLKEI